MTRPPRGGGVPPWALILALAAAAAAAAPAQAQALELQDVPVCQGRRLPPGASPKLAARRDAEHLVVTVLANFGCGIAAIDPRVEYQGRTLTLSVRSSPSDGDPLRCLCTRELVFRMAGPEADGARIRYVQDGRLVGELDWREAAP